VSKLSLGVDLSEQPRNLPPSIRVHRQEVDDVGPWRTDLSHLLG
jgi:hypothetical protein